MLVEYLAPAFFIEHHGAIPISLDTRCVLLFIRYYLRLWVRIKASTASRAVTFAFCPAPKGPTLVSLILFLFFFWGRLTLLHPNGSHKNCAITIEIGSSSLFAYFKLLKTIAFHSIRDTVAQWSKRLWRGTLIFSRKGSPIHHWVCSFTAFHGYW